MTITRTPTRPAAAALLAGGLLLLPLAACSDVPADEEGAPATTGTPAEDTATDGGGGENGSESAGGSEAGSSPAAVDCSGRACELTLQSGQDADVLGTTVGFTSSEDGTATLQVGNDDATCRQGEAVAAGPLSLECTTVTADSVTLTATLG